MDHFSAGDWVDFVRGVSPASTGAAMQAHLDRGCAECIASSDTWRLVVELSLREARLHPDESTVRIAKAMYTPQVPASWLMKAARLARLVFDSYLQPSPALLRGTRPVSRQLLHEVEPFVIDLRLESEPARKRVFLMGQILNSEHPEQPVSNAEVVVLAGDKLIRRRAVNDSGEFDMELDPGHNLYLFIDIRGQRAIGIALPDL